MIPKIIHLDPYFPTGELTVQPVLLWANGRPCYEGITKHASVGAEYFKTIKPVPGHSFVYVLAVSAWETYGENRNGDSFPEHPYKEDEKPPWISPQDVLPLHYKTFEQFGYSYLHHANKDPAKAIGKVVRAFWNQTMHRIELLVDLDNVKAANIVERIGAGEFPPVSMGTRVMYDVCFTAGTLIRTNQGHKNIEEVQVGDTVRTHTGKLKKVTDTFVSHAENTCFVQGWGTLPVETTPNHPFFVVQAKDFKQIPTWQTVADLHLGDFVGIPVDRSAKTSRVGADRARLLGYYLGDGCPHYYLYKGLKYPTHIVLSLNKEEVSHRKRIEQSVGRITDPANIAEYGYRKGNMGSGFSAGNASKGTRLYIKSRDLTGWCIEHCGTGARTKRLAETVFSWSEEEKLNLLGAYVDSDGCYYKKRNYTVMCTVNRGLALDLQRLGLSVGIPISLNYTEKSSHGYSLFIPAAFSVKLAPYSVKILPIPTKTKPRLKGFFRKNYWWTPIRKIEESDATTSVVYNLSVEDDESYLANGLAVHNCSICGNRAPTRAQYCDHLKFQMRDVVDGRKVSALNPSPKFFDISFVFRGADPVAFMLKKVAHDSAYELSGADAGEYLEQMTQTKNAARKMAVIDKIVQGIPVDAKAYGMDPAEVSNLCQMRDTVSIIGKGMQELPENLLRGLSEHSMPKIFSSMMASGGMMLSTPEVVKITIYKVFPKSHVADSVVDRAVGAQNSIQKLFEDYPQLLEKIRETGILDMGVDHIDSKIMDMVSPFMEKRSGIAKYLKRQLVPENWRDVDPNTQQLSITDPGSGNTYGTTVGAATRAHDEIAKSNLKKVVGGAALLGGAYKLIGSGLDYKGYGKLKPLVALGLGALGVSQWPSMGKHYVTDQGVPIPTMTEFAKVSGDSATSLALPLLGTLGTMALMSHDYQSRLRSGIPIGYQGLPLSRRILDQVEDFADKHPLVTSALAVVGLRRIGKSIPGQLFGRKAQKVWEPVRETVSGARQQMKDKLKEIVQAEKLSSYMAGAVSDSTSTVILPEIDLEKVSLWLGDLILNG